MLEIFGEENVLPTPPPRTTHHTMMLKVTSSQNYQMMIYIIIAHQEMVQVTVDTANKPLNFFLYL